MMKKFTKILSTIMIFCMVATLFAVPMTASAETPAEETYEQYDEIGYADLNNGSMPEGGVALPKTDVVYNYSATSATHSAIFKVRVTFSTDFRFQVHFSSYGSTNNFAYQLKDGKWYDRGANTSVSAGTIKAGDSLNIETARLKVKTGENAGKYYTYFKVNDVLLFEKYVAADDTNTANYLSDAIYFNQKVPDTAPCTISPYYEKDYDIFEAYDEIGYENLLKNGNPVSSDSEDFDGTYTYNKTSPTGSVILKYRWISRGASDAWLSFDKAGNSVSFRFGVQYNVNSRSLDIGIGYNGGTGSFPESVVMGTTASPKTYDVEFARLKVANGPNAGKYYMYFKIDDVIVAEDYVAADVVDASGNYTSKPDSTACTISNEIRMSCWGGSNTKDRITYIPVAETYEAYDEIGYLDLLSGGNPISTDNRELKGTYTYNKTSPTGSVILKYRWISSGTTDAWISFDRANNGINYRFGVQYNVNSRSLDIGIGYNGGTGSFPESVVMGTTASPKTYDVEFARLKVANGPNAGKYYMYFKIDDVIVAEDYVAADVVDASGNYTSKPNSASCTISNEIYMDCWGGSSTKDKFTYVSEEETYEPYDEINYTDLKSESGQALGETTSFTGSKIFTYNRTSSTGSAILKYRWMVGSVPKFQLSFDHAYESNGTTKSIDYMFGVQVSAPSTSFPNGDLYLRPGYGKSINLPTAFEHETVYDIEFARLKVATGPNKGKYYVYIKIDGVLIAEAYTAADIVDSNNHYTTKPGAGGTTDVAISNKIFMTFYGSNGNIISQSDVTAKSYNVNFYANGELVEKVPFTVINPSISGKEPAVPTVPNATGVWEPHNVSNLTKEFSVNAIYTVTPPSSVGTEITLNAYNGAEVDLNTDLISEYRALPTAQQSDYVRSYSSKTSGYQDHQNITFRWSDLGENDSYTVYFADNREFDNAYFVTASGTELVNKVGIFVPGRTYYWFVTGNDTGKNSAVDTFTAADTPVRYITAGAVTNMRDEGGYVTVDGQKVNYGLVYRGAALDEDHSYVDATARNVFRYLGMKSEIELRGGLDHNRTGWDYNNTNVYYIAAAGYTPILSIDSGLRAQYKATFDAMADRNNYPFYFHCSAGADRTGTFAYLLNGLLGVPYENLREDYELTTFSEIGTRAADSYGSDSFDQMHNALMAQYDDGSGDISKAIEKFLKEYIGVEQKTLNSIKEIMLETELEDLDRSGTVDAKDVLMLKQAILSDSTDLKYDLNRDGNVDILDLIYIKKYLCGITLGMVSLQVGSTSTDYTIVWCMGSANPGKVRLAKKADMTGIKFPSVYEQFTAEIGTTPDGNMYSNTVKLTNLEENTEYVYRVGNGYRWSEIYSFKTQSCSDGAFTFLLAGDPQIGGNNDAVANTKAWADSIEKGLEQTPDASFLLILGDQTESPSAELYTAFFSPDDLKSIPIASVVGNHELGATYSAYFKMPNLSEYGVSNSAGSGSGDYWFVRGNTLFMVLNTNNTNVSEHQQFMNDAITANPNVKWKVVSMHQTLFGAAHNPSAMDSLRASLAPIFSNLDIDVVLSAHDHSYVRTYMMNGTTPVIPESGVPSSVTDPADGQVLYVSLNSSSASRFFGWESGTFPYVAFKNQENVPNISSVSVTDTSFTVTTYRTTDMTVVDEFTIYKGIN